MKYKIINILIEIVNLKQDGKVWEYFRVEKTKLKPLYFVKISEDSKITHEIEWLRNENQFSYIFRLGKDVLFSNENWKENYLLPIKDREGVKKILLQIFYTHAVQRHIIQLHSSLISYNREGILFLGPSGIGKTTQAELWNQYRDALIINGDVVFVQETEERFLGWGTPWHGSSPYCENASVPVHAMIVLKQAPENSIRELTGFEKVTAVSNNVFYPQWLENGMELCLETLDHLLSAVPVYELSCRPDEEAVRLTEETLFGK